MVAALLAAAMFGAGDQYVGSLSAHPWATQLSLLSAPWILVAFLAGWTQRDPRRAALLGLGCTFSALAGYGLMTLSPIENAALTVQSVTGFLQSERAVIAGGLVTGPLFGWLGCRWRNDRAWAGALLVAAAVCLEPLARAANGDPITLRTVWVAEVAVGLVLSAYVATVTLAPPGRARRFL